MPALPVHHTATVDESWDGPAAVKAMPNDDEVLEYCHAWQSSDAANAPHKEGDDDADDKKANYKFPHHKTKGGPANIPGCNNGKARLANANIPEADKPGVEKHLQAHIDDSKKDDDSAADHVNGPLVAMRFPGERAINIVALAGRAGWNRAVQLGQMTDEQRVQAGFPRVRLVSNRSDNAKWLRITDYVDGTPARIDIDDEIGWSFWGDGITASWLNEQLAALQAPSVELHINSPGGDVFDGIAMLNALRSYDKPIDVIVDGLAASAASFIAQAGDTVTMMPNSQMMIHDAAGFCMGNTADMQSMADLLDKQSANIADVYAMRSGVAADEWRTAMKAETWYTADEAVAAGLADKVGAVQRGDKRPDPEPVEAPTNRWNLSFYAYSGRTAAPAPVLPAGRPSDGTPAPGTAAPVHPEQVDPVRGQIDPEKLRARIASAFTPTPKEARR